MITVETSPKKHQELQRRCSPREVQVIAYQEFTKTGSGLQAGTWACTRTELDINGRLRSRWFLVSSGKWNWKLILTFPSFAPTSHCWRICHLIPVYFKPTRWRMSYQVTVTSETLRLSSNVPRVPDWINLTLRLDYIYVSFYFFVEESIILFSLPPWKTCRI